MGHVMLQILGVAEEEITEAEAFAAGLVSLHAPFWVPSSTGSRTKGVTGPWH